MAAVDLLAPIPCGSLRGEPAPTLRAVIEVALELCPDARPRRSDTTIEGILGDLVDEPPADHVIAEAGRLMAEAATATAQTRRHLSQVGRDLQRRFDLVPAADAFATWLRLLPLAAGNVWAAEVHLAATSRWLGYDLDLRAMPSWSVARLDGHEDLVRRLITRRPDADAAEQANRLLPDGVAETYSAWTSVGDAALHLWSLPFRPLPAT